ncbi:serine protease inhibitor [Arthrobacter sp. zg-Y179]|uniref:serine protease inhibitor n=1 Tax=Arthrobacter sp. zg-Y179 TaxID=2894188 RepID=UPI001E55DE6F|nr:serine protease inhibitor [Arthrobacter sp. zg-Y179]MCC9174246.1 serine protease inhibitor [Arthrobacter sp. zg-Y179]
MRNIRGSALVPILLCTAVLLAACGGDSGRSPDSPESTDSPNESTTAPTSPVVSPTPIGSPTPAPGTTAEAPVSLTVEFSVDGTTPSSTWTLQCDGAEPREGSTVPDPAGACAVLADQGAAALAEPAAGLMCTQEIRGMQRAHVTGMVRGEAVDASFSLTDGCQISRWERLTALLGPADGSL